MSCVSGAPESETVFQMQAESDASLVSWQTAPLGLLGKGTQTVSVRPGPEHGPLKGRLYQKHAPVFPKQHVRRIVSEMFSGVQVEKHPFMA